MFGAHQAGARDRPGGIFQGYPGDCRLLRLRQSGVHGGPARTFYLTTMDGLGVRGAHRSSDPSGVSLNSSHEDSGADLFDRRIIVIDHALDPAHNIGIVYQFRYGNEGQSIGEESVDD